MEEIQRPAYKSTFNGNCPFFLADGRADRQLLTANRQMDLELNWGSFHILLSRVLR